GASINPPRGHLGPFAATGTRAVYGGYVVRLARSGRSIEVSKGQTIPEALQLAGLDVPSSCQQGVCGVCETTVLQGIPDHRDLILTDDEKKQNNTMMICCSGSLTSDLTLEI